MNDTGRRQCQRLKLQIQQQNFNCCYTSPQVRCVETSMILIGDRVEMIPDKRLINRYMGDLEGQDKDDYNAYKFWDYDLNKNDYGVEPLQDVFSRCVDFIDYLKEKYTDGSIMLVVDEEIYRALRYLLVKKRLHGNLWNGIIYNCQIETFDL